MMSDFKKLLPLLLGVFLLALLVVPGFATPAGDQQVTESQQPEEKVFEDLYRSDLEDIVTDDGMVEILILLKEQADTKGAASKVKEELMSLAEPVPDFQKLKDKIAVAVVETLQDTAAQTQAPLLDFLESQKAEGRVEEIKSFFIVNTVFVRVSKDLVDDIAARPEVESVRPNMRIQLVEPVEGTVHPASDEGIEWNIGHINVPAVWDQGIDGSGVVVGIIDTGVCLEHETLRHKYRGYDQDGDYDHAYNWFDPYNDDRPAPDDVQGHGTHVAGTVLGSDEAEENLIGVAPGAQWIAARGLDDTGAGNTDSILAAGEYLLAPTPNPDGSGTPDPTKAPDIINNSWGGRDGFLDEWYRQMVKSWRDAGILPVFAAGNFHPALGPALPGSLTVPANYPESFAVAATDNQDKRASFSNLGSAPYPWPEDLKPDISAPGVDIRSAVPGNQYDVYAGTSMAAPHIAGTAALLLESNPGLSVTELENMMLNTSQSLTDSIYSDTPNYGFGFGLVDALAALDGATEPPAVHPEPPHSELAYAWSRVTGDGLSEGAVTIEVPGGLLGSLKDVDDLTMSGADFVDDTWYAVNWEDGEPSQLYTIDTDTGVLTSVGYTGIKGKTGLAYDPAGQTLYSSAIFGDHSTLYEVDLDTAEVTEVGQIVTDQAIVGLASDREGNLYGLNMSDNSLYSICNSTGEGTKIGSIGFNISFINQDLAFDRDNNTLYGTLLHYIIVDGRQHLWNGLCQLDTATGEATVLNLHGSAISGFAIPYEVEKPEGTFTDVPPDHPFYDEIEALAALGISEGYEDGTFRPSANVTRMAMAAFLVRGLELEIPEVGEPTFTDVRPDNRFFDKIEALAASGISTGFEEDDGTFTFRPSENVTRMAVAAFLTRGLELDQDYDVPGEPTFSDVSLGHPFFEQIELLAASGISTGFEEDDGTFTFRPSAEVTRMAMAAFLVRGLELE